MPATLWAFVRQSILQGGQGHNPSSSRTPDGPATRLVTFYPFEKPCFANDIEPFWERIYDEPGVKNCKLFDPLGRRVFAI
jgi:hypothetical protein